MTYIIEGNKGHGFAAGEPVTIIEMLLSAGLSGRMTEVIAGNAVICYT